MGLVARILCKAGARWAKVDQGIADLARLQKTPGLEIMKVLLAATRDTAGQNGCTRIGAQSASANIRRWWGSIAVFETQTGLTNADERRTCPAKKVVHEHAEKLAMYLCTRLWFQGAVTLWHCPACGNWESMPPRLTAELETAGRHLFPPRRQPLP